MDALGDDETQTPPADCLACVTQAASERKGHPWWPVWTLLDMGNTLTKTSCVCLGEGLQNEGIYCPPVFEPVTTSVSPEWCLALGATPQESRSKCHPPKDVAYV